MPLSDPHHPYTVSHLLIMLCDTTHLTINGSTVECVEGIRFRQKSINELTVNGAEYILLALHEDKYIFTNKRHVDVLSRIRAHAHSATFVIKEYDRSEQLRVMRYIGLIGTEDWVYPEYIEFRKLLEQSVREILIGILENEPDKFPLWLTGTKCEFNNRKEREILFKDLHIKPGSILHQLEETINTILEKDVP